MNTVSENNEQPCTIAGVSKRLLDGMSQDEKTKLDSYPKVELSRDEFDKLPEYSMSNPTQSGSVGIKQWKRRTPLNAEPDEAIWFLGQVKDGMNVFSLITNVF